MSQIIFVVWRESVEALLVIAILHAWLRNSPDGRTGIPWLWGGVIAGCLLALFLALLISGGGELFQDQSQYAFQGTISVAACLLVVQMVFWMRKHARTLKADLERDLDEKVRQRNWWGVASLAMIAVAREGSETAVFLYGIVGSAIAKGEYFTVISGGVIGFLAALFSYYLLQLGSKIFTWRRFFQVTEIVLLFLAASMLMNGVDNFLSLDYFVDNYDLSYLWDSSWILDAGHGLGKFLSDFAGYRDRPSSPDILLWLAYWVLVLSLFKLTKRGK